MNVEQQIEQLRVVTRYRLQVVADGQVRVPETKIDRPEMAARYFWLELGDRAQEVMAAAFVDMRNVVIAWQEAFRGTLTRCTADPRVILQAALLVNAAGIVLCHTHPMGDPDPSPEDLEFTIRMKEASELLGIRLMDHLILGQGRQWVSLKQRGEC